MKPKGDKQSRQLKLLTVLVVGLVAIVAVQSFRLYHQRNRHIQDLLSQDFNQLVIQNAHAGKNNPPFDPFKQMEAIEQQMTKIFSQHIERFEKAMRTNPNMNFDTRMTVKDGQNDYIVELKVPTNDKSNVKVNIEGQQITISGMRERRENTKQSQQVFQSHFSKTFTLPGDVDANSMKTTFKEGVLTISFTKKKEAPTDPTLLS